MAVRTFHHTAQAKRDIANLTIAAARAAIIILAPFTVITVITCHGSAAVIAAVAIPIFEPDIGTVGVVGVEYPDHKIVKVAQSALFQGLPNGQMSIPFAEVLTGDMRMRHSAV